MDAPGPGASAAGDEGAVHFIRLQVGARGAAPRIPFYTGRGDQLVICFTQDFVVSSQDDPAAQLCAFSWSQLWAAATTGNTDRARAVNAILNVMFFNLRQGRCNGG